MDLHPIQAPATHEERAAVDAVLGDEGPAPIGLRQIRGRRHLLLPALQAVQGRCGWISPGALGHICERLGVPPAEGYGVASFYALLALSERPPRVLHLCDDLACHLAGAEGLAEKLCRNFAPAGEARDGAVWLRSPCLGLCEQAPVALLTVAGEHPQERALRLSSIVVEAGQGASAHLPAGDARLPGPGGSVSVVDEPRPLGGLALDVLRGGLPDHPPHLPLPQAGSPGLRLLRRVGEVDPESLDDYRAHGGYQALRRAFEMGPTAILREVTESRLLGRGGAAFPTGRKWEAVARAPARPHYIVCNADESEPGTFKDRVLMEQDPFAVVESMTLCALAVGAERGYLYIRGEYALGAERLAHAMAQARARGLLGADILRQGLHFDIEIRRGGGAYICGEETALISSIEGLRGEPKSKPPFPVEVGLFGKPTVINNVETLVNVPDILLHGAAAFRALGTEGSCGTRLFCLSGAVVRPGLYELPFGVRLRELIEQAGGVSGGRAVQAVLLGGAAGTFVSGDALDVPLTFEDTKRIGASLGSGVVLVVPQGVPMMPLLTRLASFFRDESCGQCVPCRVGTVRQEELVARLAAGRPLGSVADERLRLAELGQVMRDASICGLGQTASAAIESAVDHLIGPLVGHQAIGAKGEAAR